MNLFIFIFQGTSVYRDIFQGTSVYWDIFQGTSVYWDTRESKNERNTNPFTTRKYFITDYFWRKIKTRVNQLTTLFI